VGGSLLPFITSLCNEKTKTSIQQFVEHPKAFPCLTFLIIPSFLHDENIKIPHKNHNLTPNLE
jgi:hypothetical protein